MSKEQVEMIAAYDSDQMEGYLAELRVFQIEDILEKVSLALLVIGAEVMEVIHEEHPEKAHAIDHALDHMTLAVIESTQMLSMIKEIRDR